MGAHVWPQTTSKNWWISPFVKCSYPPPSSKPLLRDPQFWISISYKWNVRFTFIHIHSKSKAARKILKKIWNSLENKINRVKTITGVPEVYIQSLKVAQNSFQHFPRRRFWWVIITTLYQLMLQSWYQKTAQALVNSSEPLVQNFFKTLSKVASHPAYQYCLMGKNFTMPFLKYTRLKLKFS